MAKKKVQTIVSLDPAEQAKRIDKAKSVISIVFITRSVLYDMLSSRSESSLIS